MGRTKIFIIIAVVAIIVFIAFKLKMRTTTQVQSPPHEEAIRADLHQQAVAQPKPEPPKENLEDVKEKTRSDFIQKMQGVADYLSPEAQITVMFSPRNELIFNSPGLENPGTRVSFLKTVYASMAGSASSKSGACAIDIWYIRAEATTGWTTSTGDSLSLHCPEEKQAIDKAKEDAQVERRQRALAILQEQQTKDSIVHYSIQGDSLVETIDNADNESPKQIRHDLDSIRFDASTKLSFCIGGFRNVLIKVTGSDQESNIKLNCPR